MLTRQQAREEESRYKASTAAYHMMVKRLIVSAQITFTVTVICWREFNGYLAVPEYIKYVENI